MLKIPNLSFIHNSCLHEQVFLLNFVYLHEQVNECDALGTAIKMLTRILIAAPNKSHSNVKVSKVIIHDNLCMNNLL